MLAGGSKCGHYSDMPNSAWRAGGLQTLRGGVPGAEAGAHCRSTGHPSEGTEPVRCWGHKQREDGEGQEGDCVPKSL